MAKVNHWKQAKLKDWLTVNKEAHQVRYDDNYLKGRSGYMVSHPYVKMFIFVDDKNVKFFGGKVLVKVKSVCDWNPEYNRTIYKVKPELHFSHHPFFAYDCWFEWINLPLLEEELFEI